MKTCKYGCGKMKDGGKVTAVTKMKAGGSAGCPIGQCPKFVGGKRQGCEPCKAGVIGGITGAVAGATAVAGKMLADASKKRKAVSEIKKANAGMTRKEARKKLNEPKEEKQSGGAKKKYQMGGSMIVGMPKYSNNPRSDAGRILQAGGSFAPNRAVQASCKAGTVRDENGRCVTARKMQKGGFPDLNKDGKVTKADILKGRGVIKKMGGAKKR
jgi:hypothetical protein